MPSKIRNFRKWLIGQRYFRVAWFAKDELILPDPEEALANLPKSFADDIVEETDKLLVPVQYQATVVEGLRETVSQWKARPSMVPNSMVVLGHPISSISRILLSGIEQYNSEEQEKTDHRKLEVNLLDWIERPPKSNSIAKQIKQKLGRPEHEDSDGFKDGSDVSEAEMSALNLAIIPNLSWCFLRSVEGLEGIDYLQDTLLRDRSQFWIIGSGQVGWDYLNSTLKLNAYCGSVMSLPSLTGEQIQNWLTPLIERFEIAFEDTSIHKLGQSQNLLLEVKESIEHPAEAISEITQEVGATVQSSLRAIKNEVLLKDTDEDKTSTRDYFDRLADISDGVAIVALQLFIKSLRYKIEEERADKPDIFSDIPPRLDVDGKEDDTLRPKIKGDRRLVAVTPKLPPLPDLSQSDMYLLYSLMLHGDLTIVAIAESLGDAPQIANNRVQFLRKAGVIEQRGEVVKANPIHYPRIRRELARNNFIMEVPGE